MFAKRTQNSESGIYIILIRIMTSESYQSPEAPPESSFIDVLKEKRQLDERLTFELSNEVDASGGVIEGRASWIKRHFALSGKFTKFSEVI